MAILGVIIMESRVIENAFDKLLKCEYERKSETNLTSDFAHTTTIYQ